jgi:hypothetical protein
MEVFLNSDVFINLKNENNPYEENSDYISLITPKLSIIYNTNYDYMKEPNYLKNKMKKNYNKKHNNHQYNLKNHNFTKKGKGGIIKRKPIFESNINKEDTSYELIELENNKKEILSLLNKLSDKKEKEISDKIINICLKAINKDICDILCEKIFEYGTKQHNYIYLYINLYERLINNNIKNGIIKKICDIVDIKIKKYINCENEDDKYNVLYRENIDKKSMDYDDFCKINKEGDILKGIIKFICLIYKKWNKKEILNLKNVIFNIQSFTNEIYLDCIMILHDIFCLSSKQMEILKDYEKNGDFKGKMMMKFKILDIIELKK